MFTDDKLEQFVNAEPPTDVTFGKLTYCKYLHPEKAATPIDETLLLSIDFIPVQFINAPFPIIVALGKLIVCKFPVHPANAY